ncbi:MAG TPA: DMT family transporter, partial [Roseivirga sp.]
LGVVALITHGEPERILGLQFNRGDLWMLLAVLCWSIYSVVLKQKPQGLPQKALLGSTVIIGVIIMSPIFIFSTNNLPGFEINTDNIIGLLYISLFASVFAYFFWNYGVDQIGPNKSGVFLHLMPLFGAVLSILFLNEGLMPYHWIGAALIAAGILISNRKY